MGWLEEHHLMLRNEQREADNRTRADLAALRERAKADKQRAKQFFNRCLKDLIGRTTRLGLISATVEDNVIRLYAGPTCLVTLYFCQECRAKPIGPQGPQGPIGSSSTLEWYETSYMRLHQCWTNRAGVACDSTPVDHRYGLAEHQLAEYLLSFIKPKD